MLRFVKITFVILTRQDKGYLTENVAWLFPVEASETRSPVFVVKIQIMSVHM